MTWARRVNKFNARKVEIDGIKFDSQKEARRYQELLLLQKAGEVMRFDVHPRYTLWANAPEYQRLSVLIGHYSPDFYVLYSSGEVVIEDVKSEPSKTTAYRLRKKIFEANYWPLTVTEID